LSLWLILSTATLVQGVEVLYQGIPYTPQTSGLFFTEEEAREEYRQKQTAVRQLELANSVIDRRDSMIESMYEEFMLYAKATGQKEDAYESKIKAVETENTLLKILTVLAIVVLK
jgi:Mg2+ and Co2+ transporter CorA